MFYHFCLVYLGPETTNRYLDLYGGEAMTPLYDNTTNDNNANADIETHLYDNNIYDNANASSSNASSASPRASIRRNPREDSTSSQTRDPPVKRLTWRWYPRRQNNNPDSFRTPEQRLSQYISSAEAGLKKIWDTKANYK